MNKFLAGSLAGLVATAPMTASMLLMHRHLPWRERYPLPPRQITEEVAEHVGIEDQLNEPSLSAATVAGHFGYGAVAGAIYPLGAPKLPGHPVLRGVLFGLAVWTGSYLGWLPVTGILSSATGHPARRNALMIAAHVVWGAALGALVERSDSQRSQ